MNNTLKVAVCGLGYVGINIACAFARYYEVIGYDISVKRTSQLATNYDATGEVSQNELSKLKIKFTSDRKDLMSNQLFIIAVPTILDAHLNPDLTALLDVSRVVGEVLKKGAIVVYESSVYPGVTENECIPILEKNSGLKCPNDFGVAYSPERVNPGDKLHTIYNITKLIAATDGPTLNVISKIYEQVLKSKIYKMSCIKSAEASKLIENVQRDVNIALVNYCAQIMHKMDLNFTEVYSAMQTKWNALPFKPGFVGGHCIGVNARYLAFAAHNLKLDTTLIDSERYINASMPEYTVKTIIEVLDKREMDIKRLKIAILGLSYKENHSDLTDSPIFELVKQLSTCAQLFITDAFAESESIEKMYGMPASALNELEDVDAIVITTAHSQYIGIEDKICEALSDKAVIFDLKGIINPLGITRKGVYLWQM